MARWFSLALVFFSARALFAAEPPQAPASVPPPPRPTDLATRSEFRQKFVLQTARVPAAEPHPELLRVRLNGEYQLRFAKLTDLPLSTPSDLDSLGQTERLYHWLRMTPRFQWSDRLSVVGQLDLPEGLILGQEPRQVSRGDSLFRTRQPLRIEPRWLYADLYLSFGRFRLGQAPFHSGLGMVENDGDHPSLFGDYERGSKFERLEFESGRERSPLRLLLAGDIVYEDDRARLIDGDFAVRTTLGSRFGDASRGGIGLFGIFRHQRGSEELAEGATDNVLLLNSSGGFSTKISGASGFVFGGYEVAYRIGDTNFIRALSGTVDDPRTDLRGFGAVARLGAVLTSGSAATRWGSVVLSLEWGYASADDDPLDDTAQSFRFDRNYNVGLILFDEVLRWKTARSRSLIADPSTAPGADHLPSNGAVFGATYVYPTVVFRPVPELDLKLGAVLAQTTADLVDPARLVLDGRYRNYDDGDPSAHDLGLELDGGIEYRLALASPMTLELGAQGGLFFPGKALAGPNGTGLGKQAQVVSRIGLQY